ncbi:MAG TPA: xanthine dehydrogenase family protein subunit M [Gemmatimonadota bacterium]|nr:xanthine dehydrogenase family protein subunit M [Gemmatimonadota bacterium]
MLPSAFDYVAPSSLDEAIEALASDPEARVLAGGQSLIPLLKLRLARPGRLVDLRKLEALSYVREEDGGLAIGGMTPHAEVAGSPLLAGAARAVAEAAAAVGDPQVRNRGTFGGSLAHADPSADLPAAVLAMGGTLVARGPEGEREIPAGDFFLAPWTTALRPDEILTGARLPVPAGSGGAYVKLEQRASGFALVGVAAVLELEGGVVRRARLAVTGAGNRPVRLEGAEEALAGVDAADEGAVREACRDAGSAVESPQEDLHGSAAYRRAMTGVMAARAVLRAAAR